ncbi:MAG: phosphoribosyltransferase [Epsilonproteobacteria bacterium]|nr:phosphoribosyltransferase [Campylobacterota bacterium]
MQKYKDILKDRIEAASKLKEVLPLQKLREEEWIFIAVSPGGLEIASQIKGNLKNNIDYLFSEAILAPNNPECEIARVSETKEIIIVDELVDSFNIQYDYIYGEAHRRHEENILSYIYQYRKGRHFIDVKDRVVLLLDEGSETGIKLTTAIKSILNLKPKAVYIAAPILPTTVIENIEPFADEVFFAYNIDDYVQTDLYYKKLPEVKEEYIEKILGEKE